jgi:hypothetical protein
VGRIEVAMITRRLKSVSAEIERLRAEEQLTAEQADSFDDLADDAWNRAVVSDEREAGRVHFEAAKDAAAFGSALQGIRSRVVELEARRDELLDRLSAAGPSR